jgi:glycosyltransferase involved in cell wall biosynthesis
VPPLADRESSKYLLFIGRVKPIKAVDRLIEALALSNQFERSEFVLKIAGRGTPQYIDELKQIAARLGIAGRIQFIGQVEDEAKNKLFADAYWTFLPSHTENFGHVVLESLAQNTPVLATTGTPWATLEKEKVGFWVDNSPESLARTIDKIIKMSVEEYGGYRERGRAFVINEFDIETNVHRWEEFYDSLADE